MSQDTSSAYHLTRRVIALTGAQAPSFLQNLVTNSVEGLKEGLVYSALLTPQGKFLADFFLQQVGDRVLLDVDATLADDLLKRLTMYKLRSPITLEMTDLKVSRGTGPQPPDALPDPRAPALGWRLIAEAALPDDNTDWDALRVAHAVPEAGHELTSDAFILELGLERLHGVDFRKGCYVGQEIVARMKHKTELRKGLARVHVEGPAEPGTAIMAGGKPAGTLHTRSGDEALAFLRYDRAADEMTAGQARVTLLARAIEASGSDR